MFKILKNRNFILPLAFIIGLSFPGLAQYSKSLTIPALALVMTISLSSISTHNMLQWKKLSGPLILGILLNYLILSSLILLLTYMLIPEKSLRVGMILVAASPPGVAIMPFSAILSGNMIFSLFATFGAYLAALIITPAITIFLAGAETFPFSGLALDLLYLIILPILFSRFMRLKKISYFLESWKGTITNWGLFVVIFTVIGINQASFLQDFDTLIKIALIAFLTTFPLFYLLHFVFKKLNIKESDAVTMMLLGTIKNSGFAAALAINLFDDASSSIPGAIISAVYAIYMIWLGK
jgi:bile acid:Na+ symporter, BASS family